MILQIIHKNIKLCPPWHSVPPALLALFGLGQSDPSSRRPWSFPGRTSWMGPPQDCPLVPPRAAYRQPWSYWSEPHVSELQPLPCSRCCWAWAQEQTVAPYLPGAAVCHRSWSGELEVGAAGQRRQLNGRWVVEGRCCCWRDCCWRENHNFGWSWGLQGGVDGGDGVGWWSLWGPDLDRP